MPPTSLDPTTALTVAIIAALALVIAGIINALIARAATVVSARQAAYKLNIEHCDLLIARIATMGQKANKCIQRLGRSNACSDEPEHVLTIGEDIVTVIRFDPFGDPFRQLDRLTSQLLSGTRTGESASAA